MKALCQDRPLLFLACSSMVLSCMGANAQEVPLAPSVDQRIEALQQLVAEQGRQIEALRQQVASQSGATNPERAANDSPQPPNNATAEGSTQAVRVGVAPSEDTQTPKLAQLFDQPGILTPRGHYVFEPSLQYGYSSSNRVALVGYTIIPALLIGLIDVREVKSHVATMALAGRWGITNRLEGEVKIPYVYRSDSTVSREIFTGSASDSVFNNSGKAVGDVEVAVRYQLNQPQNDFPFMIGSLRFKSRTGKDPFEVVTDCVTRCVGNTTGTGLPMELPTGSGFYSLQTGLTWLMPSDPAVFFGSFNYTHNFGRSDVYRTVLSGEREFLGSIKPGDVLGINFGVGLAINEHSTFSVGVDMSSIGRTRQNGIPVAGSVRTQLSSLLLGYSYRISPKTTVNVAVAAGLTPDTPNMTLTVRIPISF
ncbi:acetate kinase [Rhodoferax sp.]|uniref:acetate kinase n=1 Tax=Rhodoferax sp. TaxID=50421 RepID=UPI0025D2C674|nr:acetate kinase [Rhodoferax sp.]